MFGDLDSHIETLGDVVGNLDLLVDNNLLFMEEVETKSKVFTNIWSSLRVKDSQFYMIPKAIWLKDGNVNTSFFHASIKSWNIRNSIVVLKKGE